MQIFVLLRSKADLACQLIKLLRPSASKSSWSCFMVIMYSCWLCVLQLIVCCCAGCLEALVCKTRAGSGVVRFDPLRFLARCRTKRLNQLLCMSYILACFIVLLFIRPLLCIVSFRCYVFYLLVVLPKLSLLAK